MVAILCAGGGSVPSKGRCDDVTDDVMDDVTVEVVVECGNEADCKKNTAAIRSTAFSTKLHNGC